MEELLGRALETAHNGALNARWYLRSLRLCWVSERREKRRNRRAARRAIRSWARSAADVDAAVR